eukprot:Gb_22612 [translate_table: standard]
MKCTIFGSCVSVLDLMPILLSELKGVPLLCLICSSLPPRINAPSLSISISIVEGACCQPASCRFAASEPGLQALSAILLYGLSPSYSYVSSNEKGEEMLKIVIKDISLKALGKTAARVAYTQPDRIASLEGKTGQAVISKNWSAFFKYLTAFALTSVPAAIVNSGLKFMRVKHLELYCSVVVLIS